MFIIILIIIKSIGELINRLTKLLALGLISRFIGAIFGMVKLLLICCFLLSIATNYLLIDKQTQKQSILIIHLTKVYKIITPEINRHKKTLIQATKEGTKKAKEKIEKKINPQ